MQTFIVFCILAVSIFRAAGADNSTQMFYFSLNIEKSAHANISQVLTSFWNERWIVNNITETTECEVVGTNTACHCMDGYRWSDALCQTQNCCGPTCSFSQSSVQTCIADTTITITGSIGLDPTAYRNCLAVTTTPEYKMCNKDLTEKMQTVYSTLNGFDSLTIVQFRFGSVLADFQMVLVSYVSSQALVAKSINLTSTLPATMTLQTTGIVQINTSSNPVEYNSVNTIKCTSHDDLGTNPTWTLQQQDVIYKITNGTQATVTSETGITSVTLNDITELWNGKYTCAYVINSGTLTVTHAASTDLDVALLPNIDISTNPQFPHCTPTNSLVQVTIICSITQISENYTVSWTSKNITAAITPLVYIPGHTSYSAITYVSCQSNSSVTCNFTNRRNQSRIAQITMNTIKATDKFCAADGVWPDTKTGYTAVLPCTNAAGQIQRTCSSDGVFRGPVSLCVLQDLYNLVPKSNNVGTGLGSKDANGAAVFALLQNITNSIEDINTNSNINASIQVLLNLKGNLETINNQSTVNDLVSCSSNILNTTDTSWMSNHNNDSSLAEKYLQSVEELISIANVTTDQNKPNVEVQSCSYVGCNNTVFNNRVYLQSSFNGTVITTGFQKLQDLLPSANDTIPNSIVVSTTTTDKQSPDSHRITINFSLIQPRPRNVVIQCVAWDNNTTAWSSRGCTWQGAGSPAVCVCTHLSSFAILMSKKPIELAGETVMTNIGLAVSVISLLISLIIEVTVWSAVVKTNTLYLRHTAHFNISLCLLIADCCFLASSIGEIPPVWCQISVVLKHFCYLAMFFWMLCLSVTLLHQAVYLFHNVSKTSYLRFSLVLGYACPFLIVFVTFITNNVGAEGVYYSEDGCWLIYTGFFQGSIFTFIIPVGIIIFINVFSMLVVIMKLLDHPKITDKSHDKEKNAAKTVIRTVILLTPIFGVTWGLGFAVMILDLTSGTIAIVVNYAFILLNAFQGFFILLTTSIGDRMVRETVLGHFRRKAAASLSESTTKLDTSLKK